MSIIKNVLDVFKKANPEQNKKSNLTYTPMTQSKFWVRLSGNEWKKAYEVWEQVMRDAYISKYNEDKKVDEVNAMRDRLYWSALWRRIEDVATKIPEAQKQSIVQPQVRQDFVLPKSEISQSTTPILWEDKPWTLTWRDKADELTLKNFATNILPWVWHANDIANAAKLVTSAARFEKGIADEDDLIYLKNWLDKNNADKTLWYQALSIITEIPKFISEILATGGIATAWKKTAKEVAKKMLTKSFQEKLVKEMAEKGIKWTALRTATRVWTGLAWEALRTPVAWAPRILASTMDKQALESIRAGSEPDYRKESVLKSAWKATFETFVEYASERAWGVLWDWAKALWKVLWSTKAWNAVVSKLWIFNAIKKANPLKTDWQITSFLNRIGWNNPIFEMAEERVADVWHWAGYVMWIDDQEFKIPDKEQLLTEVLAFSVMSWVFSAANLMEQYQSKKLDKVGDTPIDINNLNIWTGVDSSIGERVSASIQKAQEAKEQTVKPKEETPTTIAKNVLTIISQAKDPNRKVSLKKSIIPTIHESAREDIEWMKPRPWELLYIPEAPKTSTVEPQKPRREVLAPKTTKVSSEVKPALKSAKLDTLNPTGSVFADYTPAKRATAELADNITTLDKTMKKPADEMITIYRGTGKGGDIVAGDFVTTNKQLAKDYAGTGRVIEKKVKLSDILDDLDEPLGEEYIYRPQARLKPSVVEPLIEEAKKYKTADEFIKAQGTPVYHGGTEEFDKFDASKAWTNTGWDNANKPDMTIRKKDTVKPKGVDTKIKKVVEKPKETKKKSITATEKIDKKKIVETVVKWQKEKAEEERDPVLEKLKLEISKGKTLREIFEQKSKENQRRLAEKAKEEPKKETRKEKVKASEEVKKEGQRSKKEIINDYTRITEKLDNPKTSDSDRMFLEEERIELTREYAEITWESISEALENKGEELMETDDFDTDLLIDDLAWLEYSADISGKRLYRKSKAEQESAALDLLEVEQRLSEKESEVNQEIKDIESWAKSFVVSEQLIEIANNRWVRVSEQIWKSPSWKPWIISVSNRHDVASFTHELWHELFYNEINSNLKKWDLDVPASFVVEATSILKKDLKKSELQELTRWLTSEDQNIREASMRRFLSEVYSGFWTKYVVNPSSASKKYPALYSNFVVDKNSVFYSESMIADISRLNRINYIFSKLSAKRRTQATTLSTKSRAKKIVSKLMWRKDIFINRARYSGHSVRMLDRAIAEEQGLKIKKGETWILDNKWKSLERLYQSFMPSSQRAVNNLMWEDWVYVIDWENLEKMSDVNYSEMLTELKKRWLIDEFWSWLVARDNYFSYKFYKKELPNRIKILEKSKSNIDARIKSETKGTEQKKELQDESKRVWELIKKYKSDMNRIRKNLSTMPWVALKDVLIKGWKWKTRKVIDISWTEKHYKSEESKWRKYTNVFDEITRVNLELMHRVWKISDQEYEDLKWNKWYAPLIRDTIKELSSYSKMGKISANMVNLNKRDSVGWDVLNPLLTLPYIHIRAMQTFNKQSFLNELYKSADIVPEFISKAWKNATWLVANINGERHVFNVLDSVLQESIDVLYKWIENNTFWLDWATGWLKWSARAFTSLTTGKNPFFALKNTMIDIPTSYIFSKTWLIPFWSQAKILARISTSKAEKKRFFDWLKEYNSLWGFKSHWWDINFDKVDPQDITAYITWTKAQKKKILEKWWKVLEFLPALTESFSRFTEYYRSRYKWLWVMTSYENARNVSGSFHKRGSWSTMRYFTQITPYLNSSVQISFEMMNRIASKEWAERVWKLIMFYSVIQVIQAMRLKRDYDLAVTDEERDSALIEIYKYLDKNAYQKTNFVYFKNANIKLPSNPLFTWIWTMAWVAILSQIAPWYDPRYSELISEMPSWIAGPRIIDAWASAAATLIDTIVKVSKWKDIDSDVMWDMMAWFLWGTLWLIPILNVWLALFWMRTFPELWDITWDPTKDTNKIAIWLSKFTKWDPKRIESAIRAQWGTMWSITTDFIWKLLLTDEEEKDLNIESSMRNILFDKPMSAFINKDEFLSGSWDISTSLYDLKQTLDFKDAAMSSLYESLKTKYEKWELTFDERVEWNKLSDELQAVREWKTSVENTIKIMRFYIDAAKWKKEIWLYYDDVIWKEYMWDIKNFMEDNYKKSDLNRIYKIMNFYSRWEFSKVSEEDRDFISSQLEKVKNFESWEKRTLKFKKK